MATRQTGLGRGIASLIPTTPNQAETQQDAASTLREATDSTKQQSSNTAVVTHPNKRASDHLTPVPDAAPVIDLHPERKPEGRTAERPAASRKRPVDVFFPQDDGRKPVAGAPSNAEEEAARKAWDDAAASGRLGLSKVRPPAVGTVVSDTVAQDEETAAAGGSPASDTPAEAQGETGAELKPVQGLRFAELIVDLIKPNPWQPRAVFDETDMAELSASIGEIGLLQPIVVRERVDGYELIMGERRWRAAQRAGLRKIPALIRETDDTAMLRDALLENLHRANLNPLEEATAYRQLLDDFGCTQEELAVKVSKSRSQISNTLRLLKLPPLIQKRLAKGDLQAGHARAILGLPDAESMEQLAQRVVAEGLSVRAVEEIVAAANQQPIERRQTVRSLRLPQTEQLAVRLSERFAAKVNVRLGAVGKMTIEFDDLANLNRILALIAPDDPGVTTDDTPAEAQQIGAPVATEYRQVVA